MKNLLTKISFILLLLSAVIPFGVQAGFSIASCSKFDKTGLVTASLVTVEIAVVMARGGTFADALGVERVEGQIIEAAATAAAGLVAGVVTGAEVGPAIGAGVVAGIGAGKVVGEKVGEKIEQGAVIVGGKVAAIVGAAMGAVKGKKVIENYLKESHTGKIIGRTT